MTHILRAALIAGLLAVAGSPALAQDGEETPGDEAPTFRCFVRDAQIFPDVTQLRCHNSSPAGIRIFAVDTAQPFSNAVTLRVLQAFRARQPIMVTYAPEPDLNPNGCPRRTCRRIINLVL